jgi:hypothetical protein
MFTLIKIYDMNLLARVTLPKIIWPFSSWVIMSFLTYPSFSVSSGLDLHL